MFTFKKNPYLIAEVGGNHEGSVNYAFKLIDLASKSKIDAIKFQMYTGFGLVNDKLDPKRHAHFNKYSLKEKEWIKIAKYVKKKGYSFSASVWETDMLKYIDKYLDFYKIGSGDLNCYQIIEELAKRGKPIIISTGLSKLDEIRKTIKFIKKTNKVYENHEMICIMQCTSAYPTKEEEVNLNVIKTFLKKFDHMIGYSHHCLNNSALDIAYILGAKVMEFHFTDNKNKKFRDHKLSLTYQDIKKLNNRISKIKELLGSYEKIATKSEKKSGNINTLRRGLYLNRNYFKNEKINKKDIISLRPNSGLHAHYYKKIINKKVTRDITFKNPLKNYFLK